MPVTRPDSRLPDDPLDAAADPATASLPINSGLQRIFDDVVNELTGDPTRTQATPGGAAARVPPDIPGYTFLEHLGGGGMGDVWRVTDPLGREFALKTIRVGQLTPTARDRFKAEAQAMTRVEHPNIAPVHHYYWHGDTPYFLMDVYPATLQKRLAEYQADPAKAVRLMIGVAEAVGAMHAKGYIHRDLKPGNVLLTADGAPKVSDLGLAKALAEPPSEVGAGTAAPGAETNPVAAAKTMTGAVMGTRPYMGPEQAAGRVSEASPRWDVFSLGVMLHELLAGRRPPSSDVPDLLLEDGGAANPPPSSFNPDLDPRLEAVIRRCLARDAGARYPDGAAVAGALADWPAPRTTAGRWRLGVSVALLGTAVTVTAAMLWPKTPPADATETAGVVDVLAGIQAKVRGGEAVQVIPAAGMPVWSDIAVGRGMVQPYAADDDDSMVIDSGRLILMDMPPPGVDAFRFSVQTRQLSQSPTPRFGLYAGRHRLGTRSGPADAYMALWYNDYDGRGGQAPRGIWTTAVRPYHSVPRAGGRTGGLERETRLYPTPAKAEYHTVAIEVRPSGVTFFWNGDRADTVPFPLPADQEELFADPAALPAGAASAFRHTGGYGLLVLGGACSFKNARLEAIENPD
ncbi:MAG TPA: protein kinase [Gemmataceae bacterium]|nr:protein kinase [Gemmataceae bacterium]